MIWEVYCEFCKQTPCKAYESFVPNTKLTQQQIIANVKEQRKKNKVVAVVKKEKTKKVKPIQPLPITIENFFIATSGVFEELQEIPIDFEKFFASKGSEYYTNKDKTELIRVSDHWGYAIRFCSWHLRGYKYMFCGRWAKKVDQPKKIGIISFTDLTDGGVLPNMEINARPYIKEFESRHPY